MAKRKEDNKPPQHGDLYMMVHISKELPPKTGCYKVSTAKGKISNRMYWQEEKRFGDRHNEDPTELWLKKI